MTRSRSAILRQTPGVQRVFSASVRRGSWSFRHDEDRVRPSAWARRRAHPAGWKMQERMAGKSEEKPVAGSRNPLPKGDMQVKHLYKSNIPRLQRVFVQNGFTTTRMTITIMPRVEI